MKPNPVIERIRAVRREISKECNHWIVVSVARPGIEVGIGGHASLCPPYGEMAIAEG